MVILIWEICYSNVFPFDLCSLIELKYVNEVSCIGDRASFSISKLSCDSAKSIIDFSLEIFPLTDFYFEI